MYNNDTFHNMRNLIIVQHAVGIKRSYLLDNPRAILFSNIMFVLALGIFVGSIAYDFLYLNFPVNSHVLMFQISASVEAAYLVIVAMSQTKTFDAIKLLDEKCIFLKEYFSKVETRSVTVIAVSLLSIVADVVGMWTLELSAGAIAVLAVTFAVHDTELGFYSVLISGINVRLLSVVGANVNYGSKIYRHVLLISSHIQKDFNLSILMMLGATFITTIVYCLIIFLIDSSTRTNVAIFLFWRELKSLYSLWSLCSSAAHTKVACCKIVEYLSNSLAFNFKSQDERELQTVTERLLLSVKAERPRYVNGSIFTMDLGVPLRILEISVNYLLIILQIYEAYVMKQ